MSESTININYNGTSTDIFYAIIRRIADYKVWNTTSSTWVAFVNANIASYITLFTHQGGDLYTADFPSAINPGDYFIYRYKRIAATPATTDTALKTQYLHWSGGALAPATGSVTLSAYALTSLERQKRYQRMDLTDTTYDDLLRDLINSISDRIEQVTNRKYKQRTFVEIKYGITGEYIFFLPNHPVTSITSIIDENGVVYDSDSYAVDLRLGIVTFGARVACRNLDFTYLSAFSEVPQDVQLICNELVKQQFDMTINSLNYSGDSLGDANYNKNDEVALITYIRTHLKSYNDIPLF